MSIITANGLDVDVTVALLPGGPEPAFSIVAEVGSTKLEQRHTEGAASGEIGTHTQETLQAAIDAIKADLADRASKMELVRRLAGKIT